MAKHLSLCLLLASTVALSLSSGGQAQKDVVAVTYDMKDLAGRELSFQAVGEENVKVDGIDDIIRVIVKHVKPKDWRGDRSSILEVNGTVLEIQTTKANHAEIVDLLAALRRSADVEVVAEAGLYAVDRAYYEKEIAPRFLTNRSRPLALDVAEQEKLRKASRVEKPNKVKLRNRGRGPLFSLRRAVAYEGPPRLGGGKTNEVALVGVRLDLEARITGDRRFVIMNLTQRSDELDETRNRKTNVKGEDVPLDVPRVRITSSSTTNSITVGDGVFVVIPPSAPLPGFTAKGPVPLLFMRATIWIGEEEAELKKMQGIKK